MVERSETGWGVIVRTACGGWGVWGKKLFEFDDNFESNSYGNSSNNNLDDANKLSNREYEVLQLLAEGLFNKEIAYKLSISEKTVKNHVSNIFKKIGVSDRTQAAVYAIKNNIVDTF